MNLPHCNPAFSLIIKSTEVGATTQWVPMLTCCSIRNPSTHIESQVWQCTVIPVLGRQRWEDPWGFLASQSKKLVRETPFQKIK